jgi:soluble lytic murein transglycosylase
LIAEYSDNLIAVIASYNAGGGTVNRWKRSFGTLPDLEFIEQIPYSETRDYVKQVIASTAIYAKLYNLPLKGIKLPLPPKPVNTL